ncbi:SDR family NAD(P)-dependent oxidoreductase [Cellulosilyticum sp. I15G10I2]|uniref:SDR family NAD(P)-dependent oxidoreductase n=1 Tax=Cellulosilyticum sp. I15G10I2 TaxID=1892843 RepID=UPI00085C4EE2|nr:SDR family NAD(P)-dependent oxidoreductase [Cellulosilyticum sp. I15G10I2]
MAILITGGAGYTGSHVCIELLKEGYEVVIVDNFLNSNPETLAQIREKSGKDFKLYAMDLAHKEIVERIFKENEIEGVIHFAGVKSTGQCKDQPIKYYHTNLTSTLMLCEVMSEYNIKKMVFSSSEGFYGDNGAQSTVYGSAKLMIERILKEVYTVDNSWGIKIMRYLQPEGNVYTREDIKAEDMSHIYIEAFKQIKEGSFDTYAINISNKKILVEEIDAFSGY